MACSFPPSPFSSFFYDGIVLEGNSSVNCQSAGRSDSSNYFHIVQEGLSGYLSCGPAEVPPLVLAWFEHLQSQMMNSVIINHCFFHCLEMS